MRKYCSKKCQYLAITGRPSPRKGKLYPTGKLQFVACRICGSPTKYPGSAQSVLVGKVCCDSPDCRGRSRQLKNDKIRQTHERAYGLGFRKKIYHSWKSVSRVSPYEKAVAGWLEPQGWIAQYKFVPGISDTRLPRCFWLDFALPEKKLYVELDGSIHRLRAERDARKDRIMSERGWRVLRIPTASLNAPRDAMAIIERWMSQIESSTFLT